MKTLIVLGIVMLIVSLAIMLCVAAQKAREDAMNNEFQVVNYQAWGKDLIGIVEK